MANKKDSNDEMQPQCAATFATLTEQVRQVTEAQIKMAELVNGNGHPGLKQRTDDNARDIGSLTELVKGLVKARDDEQKTKERETAERRADNRKWWLGLAAAIITAALAVAQSVATTYALLRMTGK